MKNLKALALTIAFVLVAAMPAAAQFRIGPRVGVAVNSMRLNKDVFNSDNRAGFTGGVQAEFTIPVINLGFDLSVMYVHRVSDSSYKTGQTENTQTEELFSNSRYKNRDYIEIPLNVKYKIGLPLVGKIISPYIFTGPSFAFLTSKKAITEAYENKKFDVAWNFGIGLQLFTHLQVGASYGLGMTKTVSALTPINGQKIDSKNNYWTITAAWLF